MSMQKSANKFVYRSFDLQRDLAALVSLLNDVERIDQAGEDVSEAALREQLTWSGQDPAPNNWLATLPDDASIVGYGSIQKTAHDENADIYIAVSPEYRHHGIGSQLFDRLLARAVELDAQA